MSKLDSKAIRTLLTKFTQLPDEWIDCMCDKFENKPIKTLTDFYEYLSRSQPPSNFDLFVKDFLAQKRNRYEFSSSIDSSIILSELDKIKNRLDALERKTYVTALPYAQTTFTARESQQQYLFGSKLSELVTKIMQSLQKEKAENSQDLHIVIEHVLEYLQIPKGSIMLQIDWGSSSNSSLISSNALNSSSKIIYTGGVHNYIGPIPECLRKLSPIIHQIYNDNIKPIPYNEFIKTIYIPV